MEEIAKQAHRNHESAMRKCAYKSQKDFQDWVQEKDREQSGALYKMLKPKGRITNEHVIDGVPTASPMELMAARRVNWAARWQKGTNVAVLFKLLHDAWELRPSRG